MATRGSARVAITAARVGAWLGLCAAPAPSGAAATATAAAAAGTATTVAVGSANSAACFTTVTYVMAWALPSSTKQEDGWTPVGGNWNTFSFRPDSVQLRYERKFLSRTPIWK